MTILRVLATYGIPFVLGFLVRGWISAAVARRDARIRQSVEVDRRTLLLSAATDDELLSELAKRDLR